MNPPNMNVTLWAWVIECPVLATGQLLNSLLVLYRLYEPTQSNITMSYLLIQNRCCNVIPNTSFSMHLGS